MPIVVPHKARDPVTYLDAMFAEGMGDLIRSIPGRAEGLAMRTIGLHGDNFLVGIQCG